MVQRKQARKKPKDSVLLSKDGLPADHVRRGGGSGAIVRTALPNYMRATSRSDARAGGREAPAPPRRERDAARGKVVFAAGGAPYVSRATCSSAMKGLGLGLRGGAAHVCPYSYCSFKCHADADVVPLRTLVASRRRLIKTQQSMKLKGASPFRKANTTGGGDGFFVKIYSGAAAAAPTVSSGASCSDLSTEDNDAAVREGEYAVFDHRSCGDDEDKARDSDGSMDGSCGSSDVISGGSVDLFVTKSRGCKQEIDGQKGIYLDQEAEDFGACKSDISEELDAKYGGEISVSQVFPINAKSHTHTEILKPLSIDDEQSGISADGGVDASNESSIDGISSSFGGMNFKDAYPDPTGAASSQRKRWNIAKRTTSEQGEKMRLFNPRAPNFLPVETDPEAEKVDLRHQMMGDRKNAEEWMVDYALRRAVNKLARAQKRKVEMLVQAFETVQQDDDKKSITFMKSSQPCK